MRGVCGRAWGEGGGRAGVSHSEVLGLGVGVLGDAGGGGGSAGCVQDSVLCMLQGRQPAAGVAVLTVVAVTQALLRLPPCAEHWVGLGLSQSGVSAGYVHPNPMLLTS
jgi:hypothetical protein